MMGLSIYDRESLAVDSSSAFFESDILLVTPKRGEITNGETILLTLFIKIWNSTLRFVAVKNKSEYFARITHEPVVLLI
jgi:hypothetical protein